MAKKVLLCAMLVTSLAACAKSNFRSEQEPEKPAKVEDKPAEPIVPANDNPVSPETPATINNGSQNSEPTLNNNNSNASDALNKIADELIKLTGNGPNNVPGNGGETPLVLDWNRDGRVSLLNGDVVNSILFDIDADGTLDFLEWVSPAEAILALDRNQNGRIDSGAELFGSATPIKGDRHKRASNGFIALAQYDTNQDQKIDHGDEIFARLQLWIDGNRNGSSEANEIVYLKDTDVIEISLSYANVTGKARMIESSHKSQIGQIASYQVRSGARHQIYDVYFHVVESGRQSSLTMLRFDGVK
jgi:hypothetical protein